MLYNRGPSDDWDRLATFTGDDGWSWDALQPYWRRVSASQCPQIASAALITAPQNEDFVPPADGHDITGEYDPSVHHSDGMTFVSLPSFAAPAVDSRVLQTSQDMADEFPFNLDLNDGKPLGIGRCLLWRSSEKAEGAFDRPYGLFYWQWNSQQLRHVLFGAKIYQPKESRRSFACTSLESFTRYQPRVWKVQIQHCGIRNAWKS